MANRKSSTLPRIAASSDTCPVDRIHAEQCQLVIALNESKREKINGWSVDQMISDRMNANPKLVKMIQDWRRLDAQGAALGKAKQHKKSDAVTTKATDLLHAIGDAANVVSSLEDGIGSLVVIGNAMVEEEKTAECRALSFITCKLGEDVWAIDKAINVARGLPPEGEP